MNDSKVGYEFHSVRRTRKFTVHFTKAELALLSSAQRRRGFKFAGQYARELFFEDGLVMAEPQLLEKVLGEGPRQSSNCLVGPYPRSWDNLRAILCGYVRAAQAADTEIPSWALRLLDGYKHIPSAPVANDEGPISQLMPKGPQVAPTRTTRKRNAK
jgi:hypothetical protein